MKNLIIIALVLFFSISLFAQAPPAFNYQGVARDLSGYAIADQNIGLRISILQETPNGTEIYKEIHLAATSNLGLFNIQIGTGSPINGVFSEINWGAGSHFLQVEMDENGGSNYQMIGTSQLLSVPYALYAETGGSWEEFEDLIGADTLKGVKYASLNSKFELMHQGEYGGPAFPHFKMTELYEDGSMGMASINLVKRTNYGEEPTLEFAFASSQTINRNFAWRTAGGTRMLLKGNGNLGLGTAAPKAKVHINNGDIYIEKANNGMILTSPNGQCWRVAINNNGAFVSTVVNCPN